MPVSVGASYKIDMPVVKSALGKLNRAICEAAGKVLEADVKRMLSTPGQGEEYPRQGGKKMHHASAPGDPPAVDTGRLRSSIDFEVASDGNSVVIGSREDMPVQGLRGEGGATVHYGSFLEFGTSRMAPRPFMRPVAMQYMGNNSLLSKVRAHLRRMGYEV